MKSYQRVLVLLFFGVFVLLGLRAYKDHVEVKATYEALLLHEAKTLANALLSFREAYSELLVGSSIVLGKEGAPLLLSQSIPLIIAHFERLSGKSERLHVDYSLFSSSPPTHEKDGLFAYFSTTNALYLFRPEEDKTFYFAMPFFGNPFCVEEGLCENVGDLAGVIEVRGSNFALQEALKKRHTNALVAYGAFSIFLLIVLVFFIKRVYREEEYYKASLEGELKEHLELLTTKSEQMQYQIFHDGLTGLPNRNQLIQDLSHKGEKTLVLINIDDFKQINDFYGQEIGDEVLASLGSFIESFAKLQKGKAYKLHSDEYAVLFSALAPSALEKRMQKFLEELRQFVVITDDGHDIDVMVTVGVSVGIEHLLSHADMALKKAKKERISYLLYESSMEIREEYEKNIEASRCLKRAIKDDRIVPYFQKIASFSNPKEKRYEVLMRLIGEDGAAVGPHRFLSVAKKSKLYPQLTRMVIAKSFELMNGCEAFFSVNVSIMDILNPKTVAFIIEKIDQFPDPRRITFEILESEGIENYKEVLEFVRQVKSKGCQIAIDDFGSGYSSFEHILNLHVDILKIDASLIRSIDTNANARITVETILSFAKTLGIKTCAEFVHSKEICDILEKMGVDYVQGYYLAEPLPFDRL